MSMQDMIVCPSCTEKGMSLFRRLCLAPGIPGICRTCGKKIGISYACIICTVPFFGALYFAEYLSPTLAFLAGAFGTFAMTFICFWFPLEEK